MQSFMIPALGGQIYAMLGMVTQLNLKADRTGHFDGMNTQYNGNGFHAQHFQAAAMTSQTFDAWIKTVQQKGVPLNAASYRILGESSMPAQVYRHLGDAAMTKGVMFFNDAPPDFFAGIVKRYHTGTVLPPIQQPGSATYNVKIAGN